MSNQESTYVEKGDKASNVNDETEDRITVKDRFSTLSLGNRTVVGLPFVMHSNSSIESGDVTFARSVQQDSYGVNG